MVPVEVHFLTLFPEIFSPILNSSLIGKAVEAGKVSFHVHQIREHSTDKHRTVDDTPYGGGEGMILRIDVLHRAWQSVAEPLSVKNGKKPRTILLSPQGALWDQNRAWNLGKELQAGQSLILVCGHYEGVDQRFIELCVDEEVSVGDYVLTGGELAALVLVDSLVRTLPGVVGNERSLTEESLEGGLLKYPQYTRPRSFEGLEVPGILLSGDHEKIAQWRLDKKMEVTKQKRPDLVSRSPFLKGRTD